MMQIFPWVKQELKALRLRVEADHQAKDLALIAFFELLKDMRKVLVQDLAALYAQIPASFIYSCASFNSSLFRQFAADASAMLEESGTNAQLALQNLPKDVAKTFKGSIQLLVKKQMETEKCLMGKYDGHDVKFDTLFEALTHLQGTIEYMRLAGEPPKKRHKLNVKASCKCT